MRNPEMSVCDAIWVNTNMLGFWRGANHLQKAIGVGHLSYTEDEQQACRQAMRMSKRVLHPGPASAFIHLNPVELIGLQLVSLHQLCASWRHFAVMAQMWLVCAHTTDFRKMAGRGLAPLGSAEETVGWTPPNFSQLLFRPFPPPSTTLCASTATDHSPFLRQVFQGKPPKSFKMGGGITVRDVDVGLSTFPV